MTKPLVDTDGENRAVRGFLLGLEAGMRLFSSMRQHLTHYGTPYWPEHFNVAQGHITKAEQQEWLRHLLALESSTQPAPVTSVEVPRLTDDEISAAWEGHIVPVFHTKGINPIVFGRAIEAALIAKWSKT